MQHCLQWLNCIMLPSLKLLLIILPQYCRRISLDYSCNLLHTTISGVGTQVENVVQNIAQNIAPCVRAFRQVTVSWKLKFDIKIWKEEYFDTSSSLSLPIEEILALLCWESWLILYKIMTKIKDNHLTCKELNSTVPSTRVWLNGKIYNSPELYRQPTEK